jgi:hypothetical protein
MRYIFSFLYVTYCFNYLGSTHNNEAILWYMYDDGGRIIYIFHSINALYRASSFGLVEIFVMWIYWYTVFLSVSCMFFFFMAFTFEL